MTSPSPLEAPGAAGQPDIHTTAGKIADLERRRHEAVHAGSAAAVEKQHARGKLTARERIDLLLDPGSFTEFDGLARHRAHDFGIARNRRARPRTGGARDRRSSPRWYAGPAGRRESCQLRSCGKA